MAGLPAGGGNANIFPGVKSSLQTFFGELDPGTAVFVAPFADGVKDFRKLNSGEAEDYVEGLHANGNATHVYGSIREAFRRYEVFRADQPGERVAVLVVYTDGKDNGPGGQSMQDVVREFGLARQGSDFIYYSTLGVELPAEDQAALNNSGFALYNPNPTGQVRPLRVVEPRYPLLDFGNLLTAPDATRELPFVVRGTGGLPAGVRLRPTASFPSLESSGGAVEVQVGGGAVDPAAGTAILGLRLINVDPSSLRGVYEGTIKFEPSAPGILALPVRARFRVQPPRTVTTAGSVGDIDFGGLDPRGEAQRTRAETSVPLTFNRAALAEGGTYSVRVEPDPDNPLPPSTFSVNGKPGLVHELEVGRGGAVTFAVQASDSLAPGTYEGLLFIENGSDVEATGVDPIRWAVEVERAPRTAAQWAFLIAVALAALMALVVIAGGLITGVWPFWKHPVLRGELVVIKGAKGIREIPLKGQRSVTVGAGADLLPDASGRLTIKAEHKRKGFLAYTVQKAITEDGHVLLMRTGERSGTTFGSELLADEDRFQMSPYTLEYVPY